MDIFKDFEVGNALSKFRIIVTGCGYKRLQKKFYVANTTRPTHDPIFIDGQEYKLNIGATTAIALALKGATVHIVSNSTSKLINIKECIEKLIQDRAIQNSCSIECSAVDLFDEHQVNEFIDSIPDNMPLYWVQSLGIGAGSYQLKDDNPYLRIEDISVDFLRQELSITVATHIMLRRLLPRLRKQKETRIVIVTSMSAIRYYPYGGAHCPAKAALDAYAKVADLELFQDNIFITKIRPGLIDTGMYDSEVIQNIDREIAQLSGINRDEIGIRLAPPSSVAELISTVLALDAHVPSINLVAKGQETIEGS